MSDAVAAGTLMERLDRTIEEHSLLNHPFYQKWQKGELTLDAIRGYARQYFHFLRALPTFVSAAHSQCQELSDRRQLLDNLMEEEGCQENLVELWLRFGEGLGLGREEILSSLPFPETEELVRTYRRITREGPFIRCMACLYAYEAQIPAVARTKVDGLVRFYGVDDRRTTEYFVRHGELDVRHAAFARAMIAKHATDAPSRAAAESAVDEAARALWGFLDGVYRTYVAA